MNDDENVFVARLRSLTGLAGDELAALAALFSDAETIEADRTLISEGDEPRRLHILIDGWAARVKLLPNGQRHICTLLVPGDLCDVDGLHLRFYDYGLATLTKCTMVTVERQALLALCERHPAIGRALSWLGFVDNSLLNEQTVSLACRPARQRLAHLFCELIARLKVVGHAHADGFELVLTQEKLAAALGLTTVHLNRTSRRLRTDGLIEITGRALTSPDWAALRQVAGFSPAYLHLEGAR